MSIDEVTTDLFIDSICELIVLDFERIEISGDGIIKDCKTNVTIIKSGPDWVIYIPMKKGIQKSVYITNVQSTKIKKAISERENNELIIIHEELYNDDSVSAVRAFSGIQKLRKEKPMVEEAWQQLMTVYALNMDSEKK